MECSAHRNGLVGVDALVRWLSSLLFNGLLDSGHTGRTSDKNDLVNVALLEASILHGLAGRNHRFLDEFGDEVLKLGSGEREVHVNGLAVGHGDKREVDLRLLGS